MAGGGVVADGMVAGKEKNSHSLPQVIYNQILHV